LFTDVTMAALDSLDSEDAQELEESTWGPGDPVI
jgi:hypothetical protein